MNTLVALLVFFIALQLVTRLLKMPNPWAKKTPGVFRPTIRPAKKADVPPRVLESEPPYDATSFAPGMAQAPLPSEHPDPVHPVADWLKDPHALRDVWIATEILGRPKALRRTREFR